MRPARVLNVEKLQMHDGQIPNQASYCVLGKDLRFFSPLDLIALS